MEQPQSDGQKRYVYWFEEADLSRVEDALGERQVDLKPVKMTSCQVLHATDDTAYYAGPDIFNGMCSRQGSWYRQSDRNNQILVMTAQRLPDAFDDHLDVEVTDSDFRPERFPDDDEVEALIQTEEYQTQKPPDWELYGFFEAIGMKIFFTLIGFWKIGETFAKWWPRQCASHANFLSHKYTAEIDGEEVPYSVSNSSGICSSCVETFNIIDTGSRKLVSACPGAVKFGGAERDVYLDIQPVSGDK
jgi:hypothetical protein